MLFFGILMATIGIGLIGTGFMGKAHAIAFNAVSSVFGDIQRPRLRFLADVEPKRTEQKAEEFGFERWTTDWREVVNDPSVEVVAITTPNHLHREMAIAALEAGKHVYCEKPMAVSLNDAEAMADAARRSDRITLLGYSFAKNPLLSAARRFVEEGLIGPVFDFRGFIDEDYVADPDLPWSWRLRRENAGLGVLGDITCHLVSIAHLLLGPITDLTAVAATVHKTRPESESSSARRIVENDDVAHALVRFGSGALGILASSRIAHGRKNGIRIELHGSKGTIVFDQERMNELELYVAGERKNISGFRRILTNSEHSPYGLFCQAPGHSLGFNDLKIIEVAHLLNAIAGREKTFPTFADGILIERVIHGFAQSTAPGEWVNVRGGECVNGAA
jgi:predicted dehydrogenase